MAGRRHDPVPQREGHQLGGRVPHSAGGALPRQDQAGHDLHRDRAAPRLAAHLPGSGRQQDRGGRPQEGGQGDRAHLQEPHRRREPVAVPDRQGRTLAAQAVRLHLRRRRHAGPALRQLEGDLHRTALQRHDGGLGRTVHAHAHPQDLQPAHRSLRVRRCHLEHVLGLVHQPCLHRVRGHRAVDEVQRDLQ
ncbi:hypothetical protein D9M71_651320 [compost metagenome]